MVHDLPHYQDCADKSNIDWKIVLAHGTSLADCDQSIEQRFYLLHRVDGLKRAGCLKRRANDRSTKALNVEFIGMRKMCCDGHYRLFRHIDGVLDFDRPCRFMFARLLSINLAVIARLQAARIGFSSRTLRFSSTG